MDCLSADGIRYNKVYRVGPTTIVSIVPTISPKKIVTASATQNTSCSMGNTPSTVVPAALTTGLKRDTAASTTASYGSEPLGEIRIDLVQAAPRRS